MLQESAAPQSWPTTFVSFTPSSPRIPATSRTSVSIRYAPTSWGLSDCPNPRRSGAITRKPAPVSAGNCSRHIHEESGNPCSSRTGCPSRGPSSTTWKESPFVSTRVPGSDSDTSVVHGREPALVLVDVAPRGGEERLLDLLGDGAPPVGAHGAVVDLVDRADLGGRAGEERL